MLFHIPFYVLTQPFMFKNNSRTISWILLLFFTKKTRSFSMFPFIPFLYIQKGAPYKTVLLTTLIQIMPVLLPASPVQQVLHPEACHSRLSR